MMARASYLSLLCFLLPVAGDPSWGAADDPLSPSVVDEQDETCADELECALSLRQLRTARRQAATTLQNDDTAQAHNISVGANGHQLNTSEDEAEVGLLEKSLSTKAGDNAVITVYHQTSPEIAAQIMAEGFHPGHGGWCGGGIYFATTPQATYWKAIAASSNHGFIIAVRVNVGRVLHLGKHCNGGLNSANMHQKGYDSVRFNPGDGDEVVIYDASRVLSMRQDHTPPPTESQRPYYADMRR